MALFSRIKVWVTGEVLTAADLNGEFDNLLNNFIPTSIVGYSANVGQMQTTASPGDPGTESLATNVAGELTRLRYMIQNITKGAQWYASDLENWITASMLASDAISGAAIPDGAITTAKLADGAVTAAKQAARNIASASQSASPQAFTSDTAADITGLSSAFTSNARPAVISLISGDGNVIGNIFSTDTSTSGRTGGSLLLVHEYNYVNEAVKLFTLQASNTDVTTAIQAGTATTIFPTGTSNYGMLIQGATTFGRVNFTISQASTGSPVYTYEYWNGAAWTALTITGSAPSFSTTGVKQLLFTIPADWKVSSDVGAADPTKYSIRILATTAPLTAVQTTSIEVNPQWQALTLGASNIDVTQIVSAGTAINAFDTTNGHGILIQGATAFTELTLIVSQAYTGSPVFTAETWNGSSWVSAITTPPLGSALSTTGTKVLQLTPGAGWVVNSNINEADPQMFSLRLLATTAGTQAVKVTSIIVGDVETKEMPFGTAAGFSSSTLSTQTYTTTISPADHTATTTASPNPMSVTPKSNPTITLPPSLFSFTEITMKSGVHNFKMQALTNTVFTFASTVIVTNVKMVIYEL